MLPHLTARERKLLEGYRDRMFVRLAELGAHLEATVARALAEITAGDARERQKIFWMTYAAPLGKPLSGHATDLWNGRHGGVGLEAVSSGILKNTGANARYDAIMAALDLPRLSFGFDDDQ